MIKEKEILLIQEKWRKGVIEIGRLKDDFDTCRAFTESFINQLYAFDYGKVLFKPTKASKKQFRLDKKAALSYFIGRDTKYQEDTGFALNPWADIRFENIDIILEENRAIAMGNYYFADSKGSVVKIEYTFCYKKCSDGLRIDLHHSSFPYK